MRLLTILLIFIAGFQPLSASATEIIAGPMAGYSTMVEVGIWVQISDEANIKLGYRQNQEDNWTFTSEKSTNNLNANTAQFKIGGLEPGLTYQYVVLINDEQQEGEFEFSTQQLWQWRTDPPAFKIALGSCSYVNEERHDRPGKGYGRNYQIFDHIAEAKPDMMLWLGDNIYLREPDWGSWSGYMHRYTHTRTLPEMQQLLQTGHHYAIWDDHDFGPNDADGSWIHKEWALEAFKLFWMNPSYGLDTLTSTNTAFKFNDIDFFLLDNRYHRTPINLNKGEKEMFGKAQIDWLINALKFSRAPYKMVAAGGQILNDVKIYENFAQFEKERQYLLKRIEEEEIKGVIFLTGDRHHTELSKMVTSNGIEIYDLTVSPLSSGAHDALDEANSYRLKDTHLADQNYAIMEVFGPRKERSIKVVVYDKDANEVWSQTIKRL